MDNKQAITSVPLETLAYLFDSDVIRETIKNDKPPYPKMFNDAVQMLDDFLISLCEDYTIITKNPTLQHYINSKTLDKLVKTRIEQGWPGGFSLLCAAKVTPLIEHIIDEHSEIITEKRSTIETAIIKHDYVDLYCLVNRYLTITCWRKLFDNDALNMLKLFQPELLIFSTQQDRQTTITKCISDGLPRICEYIITEYKEYQITLPTHYKRINMEMFELWCKYKLPISVYVWHACRQGNQAIVRAAIDLKADINWDDMFVCACEVNQVGTAKLALQKTSRACVEQTYKNCDTYQFRRSSRTTIHWIGQILQDQQ